MVSNPREPLFDLATLAPSDYVVIDGTRYDVISARALGLRDQVAIQRLTDRLLELERQPEPTEDEEREYDSRLRLLMRRIIPELPDAVLAALQTGDMTGLVSAFIVRRVRSSAPKAKANGWTPESSSPESPASTEVASGS